MLNLHEERSLHFFSFDKIKGCECTDRDWRETLVLSIFCSNNFIWSFHDEKTALNTLNYAACEKTSVATQSPSFPGRQFSWHLCHWELGGSLRAACWGMACATSCPEGLAGRDDPGKGWVAAQPLCSDLQSQRATAVGRGKKRSENKSSIERRGGTVFRIGQHSFITGRDVMVNKLQSTSFFFPSFCPSILKEAEFRPLIVVFEDTLLLVRV